MIRGAFRVLTAASLLILASSNLSAQTRPPAHPPRPKVVGPAKWTPSVQEVFVPYWTLESGWSTTLEMRNNVTRHDVTVTPVLRASTGQETSLGSVTVSPQHVVSLDLASAVAAIRANVGPFGSVVFRFDGLHTDNLFAASIVRREGEPIDFHFDGQAAGPTYYSVGIEGMWWIPAPTSVDYLILTNPLRRSVTGTLGLSSSFASHRSIAVSLRPGETKRIELREILGQSSIGGMGGLTLSLPGKEPISATQIVFDETTGLTAMMKMFDRETDNEVRSRVLRAPMMALTQPDPSLGFPVGTQLLPRIFLRNAGVNPAQVVASIDWRSQNSGTFNFPALTLSPGELKVINLVDYEKAGQIPPDAMWGTLKIGYTGRRADLVAIAISYDKDSRYGLQTPFSEDLSRLWVGGMWHVDGTHNTLITTGNAGSEQTGAEVTLFYNGGRSKYRMEKTLSPGQQLWVDVGHLVHDQVPDSDGNTLPPETMTGSYELRDLDHATIGELYEGKLVIDKTYGHAAYGCGSCCGYDGVVFDPGSFGGPPGIDNPEFIHANDTCSGTIDDVTGSAYNWGTSNSGVATLPDSTLHTVAVGSATGKAYEQLQWAHPPSCRTMTFTPQQPITVTPTISQNQPLWYFGGNAAPSGFTLGSTTVTLTASGGSGGTYSWSITAGASKAALQGATTNASVQVTSTSYSTSKNDVTVQLQFTPTGGTSVPIPYSLTVDSPYKLVVGSITDYGASTNSPNCKNIITGTDGYLSVIPYTVLSFTGVQIANIAVNETFASITDDYIGNNWPFPQPTSDYDTAQGTLLDGVCIIFPDGTPPSLSPQSPNLSSTEIDHASQFWFVGSLTEGSGIEVQSDVIQRYQDHGRPLAIVSPTR